MGNEFELYQVSVSFENERFDVRFNGQLEEFLDLESSEFEEIGDLINEVNNRLVKLIQKGAMR